VLATAAAISSTQRAALFDESLDHRVVGVALDTIRRIPNRLLIASDPRKGKVLRAALKGRTGQPPVRRRQNRRSDPEIGPLYFMFGPEAMRMTSAAAG
jgi:hypothetical protein